MKCRLSFIGMIAAALCSCNAEPVPYKSPSRAAAVNLMVVCGIPQTRTFIEKDEEQEGVYHPYWTGGDELGVFVDAPSSSAETWTGTLANTDESGATATFTGSVEMTVDQAHTLNCVYPSSAFKRVYANGSVGVNLPSVQSPSLTSFDPAADILVGKPYDITPSGTSVIIDDMRFARVMSVLKIVPKAEEGGVALGDKLQRLNLTAPVYIVGTAKVNVETGEIEGYANGCKDVTAAYSSEKPEIGKDAVYLVVEPQTISSGSQFTFDITTDRHLIKKTVTIPDVKFEQGKVTTLNLTIKDEHCSDIGKDMMTDVIKSSMLAAKSNAYTSFDGVQSISSAVYAGRTSKNGTSIMLNHKDDNVGIVSTSSGGKVSAVEVIWNTTTSYSGEELMVYGSNTAYSSASELYSETSRGTLIGTITKPATSVSSTSGYKYVGLVSSGYILLDQISITWDTDPTPVCEAPVISCSDSKVQISCATSGASIHYTSDGTDPSSLSTLYDGIFPITADVTIKAIAVKSGYNDSAVSSRLCKIGSGKAGEPALGMPWLELPAASSVSSYYCYTHFASMNGSLQRNYSLLYDPDTYTSYWVAYPICSDHLGSGRSGDWGYDDLIPEDKQTDVSSGYGVELSTPNYTKNEYARGHQIPNADRSGVSSMQAQTFIATNSTPQIQNGFNGLIWAQLEEAVRGEVPDSDTLYVVTGASLEKVGETPSRTYITNRNDNEEIPVPKYYWKVLLKVKRDSAGNVTSAATIGFFLPHEDLKGKTYDSYSCSVDKIEEYTGFDFFVNLDSALEAASESNSSWSDFRSF